MTMLCIFFSFFLIEKKGYLLDIYAKSVICSYISRVGVVQKERRRAGLVVPQHVAKRVRLVTIPNRKYPAKL